SKDSQYQKPLPQLGLVLGQPHHPARRIIVELGCLISGPGVAHRHFLDSRTLTVMNSASTVTEMKNRHSRTMIFPSSVLNHMCRYDMCLRTRTRLVDFSASGARLAFASRRSAAK